MTEQISDARLNVIGAKPRVRTARLFDIPGLNGTHAQLDFDSHQVHPASGSVSGADPRRGWSSALEVKSGVRYQRLYRVEGKQSTRVLSLFDREFNFAALLPTDQGLILLLSGLQHGGLKPTNRGLASLLPQEK